MIRSNGTSVISGDELSPCNREVICQVGIRIVMMQGGVDQLVEPAVKQFEHHFKPSRTGSSE